MHKRMLVCVCVCVCVCVGRRGGSFQRLHISVLSPSSATETHNFSYSIKQSAKGNDNTISVFQEGESSCLN